MKTRTEIMVAALTLVLWMIIGTFMFHYLENWTYISSFYFSVTTLTTVGLGDLHPTSDISRLFTALYIIFGVSVVIASLGIIGSHRLAKTTSRLKQNAKD